MDTIAAILHTQYFVNVSHNLFGNQLSYFYYFIIFIIYIYTITEMLTQPDLTKPIELSLGIFGRPSIDT